MPRLTVRDPNVPGYPAQVDGERYATMEAALLIRDAAAKPLRRYRP